MGVVEGRRARVHQVDDGGAQVADAVVDDAPGDEDRRRGIHPPQAHADPEDAHDRADRGHPVGLVHVGVGVENLVVQLAGETELHSTDDDRRNARDRHHRDHQPAEPNRDAEEVHGADRGVLRGEQADAGVDDEEQAHRGQGDRRDEVADRNRTMEAVGVADGGSAPRQTHGDQERDRGDEREQVLDPGRLHRLRVAEDEEDEGGGHREERECDPLETDRAAQNLSLSLGELGVAEARDHQPTPSVAASSVKKVSSRETKAFSPSGTSMTNFAVDPSSRVTSP
ncbi:hypothetical protein QE388_000794 [Microbacterium sp. SORGH_AS 969]|nr:hypothetical protein [Microbacterium sp. SORGH_AS_0969]